MDFGIQQLFTWQTGLFCLAVYVLSLVIRIPVEAARPTLKERKWWRDLILPLLPVVLGLALAAVVRQYPYPEGFGTLGARLLYGLVCGFMSSKAYRVVKAQLGSAGEEN